MNEQRLVSDDDDNENTAQVQAFINYIELMTARVESMDEIEIPGIMEVILIRSRHL